MATPLQQSLLRRTIAALAAASSLIFVAEAHAQATVTLTGATGNSCTYSSMSVTPNGAVSVQCAGTTPPPPPPPPVDNTVPGTFSMANATMSAAANTTAQVSVTRTGGGLPYTLYYWYTGDGCKWTDVGAATFLGGATTASIPAPVKAAGSTCTVHLAPPAAPAALGSQTTTTISVTAGTDPGPVIPGCPATPENMINATFSGLGNPILQMQASGQVVAIKLPKAGLRNSGQVTFGESAGGAYTPQPVTIEISINKCPGVIDTDYRSQCNLKNTNGNYNSITWLTNAYSIINSTNSNLYGLCWAGESGTQYYVNARWSYQSCAFGAQVCGFAIQYNEGPY